MKTANFFDTCLELGLINAEEYDIFMLAIARSGKYKNQLRQTEPPKKDTMARAAWISLRSCANSNLVPVGQLLIDSELQKKFLKVESIIDKKIGSKFMYMILTVLEPYRFNADAGRYIDCAEAEAPIRESIKKIVAARNISVK